MVIYEWKDWDNPCGVKGGGMMSLLPALQHPDRPAHTQTA